MANSWDDLEALLPSREDLFDLALKLRAEGLDASPAQIVDAHNLLLGLRLTRQLPPERADWGAYLAPIFCRSSADQDAFHRVFGRWAPEPRKAAETVPVQTSDRSAVAREVKSYPRKRWLIPGLFILLLVWLSAIALLPGKQPPAEQRPAVLQPQRPLAALSPPGKLAIRPAATTEKLPTRPLESVPPQTAFGWTSQQLRYAVAAAPSGLFVLWLIWGFIDRRIVLTREPGESPNQPHVRWVQGADVALFDPADLRLAGGRFRDPTSRLTRRIDARRTVAATVRKAGFYTPVYRRRRQHPEYLVLIDQASPATPGVNPAAPRAARDHLAAFGETLMAQLRAEQVITHVYHFDRDPRRCRPAGAQDVAKDLSSLEGQYGHCRLILVTDGAGLFESLSGRPVAWLGDFRAWAHRFVLTPKPVAEWGFCEATLALNGFAVAPVHPKSLALLAELWLPVALRPDIPEQTLRQVRLLAPAEAHAPTLPAEIERYGDRWLESEPPADGTLRALLEALRRYLGDEGYLLLQALAVYPELTWPLTLYVDSKLFQKPKQGSRVARLLGLSRLPWLRHGRMPDYLRLALVRRLPRDKHREVVGFYQTLLQSAEQQGHHTIALNIGPPPARGFRRKLKAWVRGDDSLYGDRIFAKVLLGGRPNWLDVELPQMLARVLPGTAWDDVATRVLVWVSVALLLGGGSFAGIGHYQKRIDDWLLARELARNAGIQVTLIGAPQTDWLEPPLVDVLTGHGFAPRTEIPPSVSGTAGEKELRPAKTWKKTNVIQVGNQARRAGDWIAQRLRYLNYGRDIDLHRGAIDLSVDPRAGQPADLSFRSHPVAANQIIVWLAAAPQVFQDSLTPQPPPAAVKEPEMLTIRPGRFLMGSPAGEEGRSDDEGPQHRVKIAKPFALGRHEVTFDEYDVFAQETNRELPDDEGWGRGRRPVINVSWDDAQAYAAWLSEKTGKAYRLPSEAEWEYAARAGTTTSRYWGNDPKQACAYANVEDHSHQCQDGYENQTAPVGSFKPNPFGLQDMLGNVWEWVEDCWHQNYDGAPNDGSAWEQKGCASRVLRGGSWLNEPVGVRAANRGRSDPGSWSGSFGFRLARTLN